MKKIFHLTFLIFIVLTTYSCATTKSLIVSKLPEPKVKTDYKVGIGVISNIGSQKHQEIDEIKSFIFNKLNPEALIELHKQEKYVLTNEITDKTNIFTNKSDIKIDIAKLAEETIKKLFFKFVESLGKNNITVEEIVIENLKESEEGIVKILITNTNSEYFNYIYDEKITNTTFESNFNFIDTNEILSANVSPNEVSNYLYLEVLEKKLVVTKKRLPKNVMINFFKEKYPWILKATNNSKFVYSEKGNNDYIFNFYFSIYTTNLSKTKNETLNIALWVVVSNNIDNTIFLFKTNLEFNSFLMSEYNIFDEIKPFIYKYRVGSLLVEVDEDFDIYIDDFLVGNKSIFLPYIMEGYHKITFAKWNNVVNELIFVKSGVVNKLKKEMKKYKEISEVYINSNPVGAKVFIENSYVGETPLKVLLTPGTYRVWLNKNTLDHFGQISVSSGVNKFDFTLYDLGDTTKYEILTGVTTFLGVSTGIGIVLYIWSDDQKRKYNEKYLATQDQKDLEMREYYRYFSENMRSFSITSAILTFVVWGITLNVETGKFSIKLDRRF